MGRIPLRRNRDFVLLQAGQLLSSIGTESTTIAYPLLVLSVTHSPAKVGVVTFARIVPYPFFGVLSGVAADRWNRRRLMIAADGIRVLAVGTLAAALLSDRVGLWQIVIVAFVEGTASVLFYAAQSGALRAVVPPRQLPAAVSTEVARQSVVGVAGPPLGGVLFGFGRAVPFLFDSVSYACSTLSLLAMRTPFQEEREPDRSTIRSQIAEGFRFLWSHPFLRTCALLFGLANFIFPGVLIVIVVAGKRQGLSSAEIGGLTAVFGVSLLIGSLLSPLLRRLLPVRRILLLELWTWTGTALFVIWPNVLVLVAGILPQALVIPTTDSVVVGYRTAVTPDRLIGRVNGAARNIALCAAPLGPLAAGLLLSAVSARWTVAFFAACGLTLALWGTLSPSIRKAPSLSELDELPVRDAAAAPISPG
jgi:MFS family permease